MQCDSLYETCLIIIVDLGLYTFQNI